MRRTWWIAAGLAVLAAVLVGCGGSSTKSGTYTVDAVFDNAKGLIPSQLVKVAGAKVGKVTDITLTRDYKALVHMEVDARFGPFRRNAACSIRPEGLIGERFIDCNPGAPDAPALRGAHGQAPMVAIDHNTEPVSLTDLFQIFSVPTRDRLRIVLNEIGLGLAGRGEDLNAVIRRANPALALARRTIGILESQRDALATSVDASDRVIGSLAHHDRGVQDFIVQASRVAQTTALHRGSLGAAIKRLPPLLAATRPALRSADTVLVQTRPLLDQLRVSAPALNRLSVDVPRFARTSRPALAALDQALARGTGTVRRTQPLIRTVQTYLHRSLPSTLLVGRLFSDLQRRGFVEYFFRFLYSGAAATSRYDSLSHIFPAQVNLTTCSTFATTPVPGCSANYTSTGATAAAGTSRPRPASRASTPRSAASPSASGASPAPGATSPAPPGPAAPPAPAPPVAVPVAPSPPSLGGLLDYLLK